ncbi:MAG: LytTR family DNA-binding domain-containing protein [Bacteroidota bacterium]
MIKTVIIEDEVLTANKLERLLRNSNSDCHIVKRLTSLAETLPYLQQNAAAIDLIFMDIHLGDGSSFELFDQMEIETPIIFTTAYDQYAIRAFQQNSIDYLLKPISKEGVERALEKFEKYFNQSNLATSSSFDYQQLKAIFQEKPPFKDRFIVSVNDKIRSVNTNDIAFFFSLQGTTYLTTFSERTYDINYTLENLTPLLDDNLFFRVNRKIIVQIGAVHEAIQFSERKLKLELQPAARFEVLIPKERQQAFKSWLGR